MFGRVAYWKVFTTLESENRKQSIEERKARDLPNLRGLIVIGRGSDEEIVQRQHLIEERKGKGKGKG